MSVEFAPEQLPFAPKPLPDELLSSWLLRLAAANAISLLELLDGLRWRYPESLVDAQLLDFQVPGSALQALSQFGRTGFAKLRKLDLSHRLPHINSSLLLRFQRSPGRCPRGTSRRVRYAFCPQCLSEQEILHIQWDWCVATLIRCARHRSALVDACQACGSTDPLTFSADPLPHAVCHWCGADLTQSSQECLADEDAVSVMEAAYRATLVGIVPSYELIGKTTVAEFRRFVEDMQKMLTFVLSSGPTWSKPLGCLMVNRSILLSIIAELVRSAAPTNDSRQEGARLRDGLALWSKLFTAIPERQGEALEQSMPYWPASLGRVFASALDSRRKKRWPYDVYSPRSFSPRFRYNTLADVQPLRTRLSTSSTTSGF